MRINKTFSNKYLEYEKFDKDTLQLYNYKVKRSEKEY